MIMTNRRIPRIASALLLLGGCGGSGGGGMDSGVGGGSGGGMGGGAGGGGGGVDAGTDSGTAAPVEFAEVACRERQTCATTDFNQLFTSHDDCVAKTNDSIAYYAEYYSTSACRDGLVAYYDCIAEGIIGCGEAWTGNPLEDDPLGYADGVTDTCYADFTKACPELLEF